MVRKRLEQGTTALVLAVYRGGFSTSRGHRSVRCRSLLRAIVCIAQQLTSQLWFGELPFNPER